MSFRLVTKIGEMAHILRFSPNSAAFGAHYVKVVEDKPQL